MEDKKRSLIKTVSWRIIAFAMTFFFSFLWLQEWTSSVLLALTINVIKAVVYYLHERGWNAIQWGYNVNYSTSNNPALNNQALINPTLYNPAIYNPVSNNPALYNPAIYNMTLNNPTSHNPGLNNPTSNSKGFTLWFTGLPCSGKSTIADVVASELKQRGVKVQRLDGDIIRKHLWKELGFSKEDRDENIRRATYLAKLLTENGIAVLTTFISPYRELRDNARKEIGSFVEIYVDCPLEVCIQRDSKGMYKKALAGEIENFTGVNDPYEEPLNPEVTVYAAKQTLEECGKKILDKVKKLGYM